MPSVVSRQDHYPIGLELVDSDDAIGPHIVLVDLDDGERSPISFNRVELTALRDWANRVLLVRP